MDSSIAELLGGVTCQVSKNCRQNDRWWQIKLAIEKTGGFPGPVLQSHSRGAEVRKMGSWKVAPHTSKHFHNADAEEGVRDAEGDK